MGKSEKLKDKYEGIVVQSKQDGYFEIVEYVNASQGVDLFSPKRVYICCELIIANNDQKYTDNKEVMEEWKANLAEGTQIRTVEIDGKEWYSIVRLEDGKTMKPYDFEEVVLDLH